MITRFTGTVRSSTHGATGNDELTDTNDVFDRYTYDYVPSVEKGTTIYIKTVLKDDTYMNDYYLVGYSINGTVYQLHTVSESDTRTVTETFTIPEDWDYNYVEITPIYFVRGNNTIKFFVEGYDQTVMDAGWGNTVGVYPFYQDPTNNDQVANKNNAFGGYPGQPLVFYKGNYYAEIPKTITAYTENSTSAVNCEIKGITLSNMYWDDVHLYTGEVSLHYQTYDFDDLYKIYTEYKDGTGDNELDRIVCAFKYRNRKNNDEPANMTGWTSTNYENYTNGWELLKNYRGEAIDLFGNVLTDQTAALAKEVTSEGVVHVISQDYKSNCAGDYATEYAVYNTAGTKVVESGGKTTTEAELRSYFYDQITTKAKDNIELDNQFVQSKAPFENNYRQNLIWVVDQVTFNQEHTEGYLTAHQEDLNWSTATVHDFTNAGDLVTHKMAAPYMKLFNKDVTSKPSFETAAAETEYINSWTVADGNLYTPLRSTYRDTDSTDKPLYIDHWDLYQLESFTYNKDGEGKPVMLEDGINLAVDTAKSVLVAKTYSASFNYVGFEDYAVVPVYSKSPVDRQGTSDNLTAASATLLTITRNHWNANTSGNDKGGAYINGADRIYVDFMLNYNYTPTVNGKRQSIQLSTTGNNIIVGFVIKSYTMDNGGIQYRGKEQVVLVNKSEIDNKNRIEYCYGFKNSQTNSQWGLMFEFTPFIVDTDSQTTSEGADVKIGNTTYRALYAVNDSDILRGVNFYMIGK